ncbi:MAG: hypothetical protein ACRBBU_15090 [Pseudooceanicola sp.]
MSLTKTSFVVMIAALLIVLGVVVAFNGPALAGEQGEGRGTVAWPGAGKLPDAGVSIDDLPGRCATVRSCQLGLDAGKLGP